MTPITLPFCTPPRAYTPSRCSCQQCKKDHQCPRPQLDGGDAHRAMLPDHARYPSQERAARVRWPCRQRRSGHQHLRRYPPQAKKSTTGSLPPAVPLAITPSFRPWSHTSDDSYIYQLSLVIATATVSLLLLLLLLFSHQRMATVQSVVCVRACTWLCLSYAV